MEAMTMSRLRWVPILSVLAALSLTLPARASTSTLTITDPSGDWQVGSQDIVKLTLRSLSEHGKHVLVADIDLASPVGPAYTAYIVNFRIGVTCYALATTTVNGQPAQQSAGGASTTPSSLSAAPCAYSSPASTGAAATSLARGSSVEIREPYALGLRPGLRLTAINVAVGTEPTEMYIGVGAKNIAPATGDFATTKATLPLR
jgi:hypothetical protein